MTEKEILTIMNLRRKNNAKWIVDISENIYAAPELAPYLPLIERSLMFADGVVTSTPLNKEIYAGLNENIYVLPSALDFSIWDNLKPVVSRKMKIGYFGGELGLKLAEPAFKEIKKKYPDVEFVNIFIDGVIGVPQKLAKLGISMCVFPMVDGNYNRSRNNIDILEMMALKVPVIASPVYPYSGLPVFYCSTNYEYFETLENLITDKEQRKDAGQKGYDFVHKEYDMKKLISNFQSWLNGLERKDY
jgi:hypothetical protein